MPRLFHQASSNVIVISVKAEAMEIANSCIVGGLHNGLWVAFCILCVQHNYWITMFVRQQ